MMKTLKLYSAILILLFTAGSYLYGIASDSDSVPNVSDTGKAGALRDIPFPGEIVISKFSPNYNHFKTPWCCIELVNKTNKSFDLSQLKIAYQAANGTPGTPGGNLTGTLLPYSYWLLSNYASVQTSTTDGAIVTGFDTTSGQLALMLISDNTIIDGLAYGTITVNNYGEGTAAASPPSAIGGLKRSLACTDTNNNSANFTTTVSPTIRNHTSVLATGNAPNLPATVTDFIVNGAVALPNDVLVTNSLTFLSGNISLGSYRLSVVLRSIALTGGDLWGLSMSNTSNSIGGSVTSIPRTWTISGLGTSTLKLTYNEINLSASLVSVWKRTPGDPGDWTLVGSYIPVDNGTTRTVTVPEVGLKNGTKGYYDYTITSYFEGTLPVELSAFDAVPATDYNSVNLNWTVESETNHLGYDVLRSYDNDISHAQKVNNSIITEGSHNGSQILYQYNDSDLETGSTYFYWLASISLEGMVDFYGPISVNLTIPPDGNGVPIIPNVTSLQKAFPNPFNPTVTIAYGLAKSEHIQLLIYNNKGQKIRTLLDDTKAPGSARLIWDGKTDRGDSLSSGVYFVKMSAGKYNKMQKLVLIK